MSFLSLLSLICHLEISFPLNSNPLSEKCLRDGCLNPSSLSSQSVCQSECWHRASTASPQSLNKKLDLVYDLISAGFVTHRAAANNTRGNFIAPSHLHFSPSLLILCFSSSEELRLTAAAVWSIQTATSRGVSPLDGQSVLRAAFRLWRANWFIVTPSARCCLSKPRRWQESWRALCLLLGDQPSVRDGLMEPNIKLPSPQWFDWKSELTSSK